MKKELKDSPTVNGGPTLVIGVDSKPLPEEAKAALKTLEFRATIYSDRVDNPALLRGLQTLANRGLILRHRTKIDGATLEIFSPKPERVPGFEESGYVATRLDGSVQDPEAVAAELSRRRAVPPPAAPVTVDMAAYQRARAERAMRAAEDKVDAEAFRELLDWMGMTLDGDEQTVLIERGATWESNLPKVAHALRCRLDTVRGQERAA